MIEESIPVSTATDPSKLGLACEKDLQFSSGLVSVHFHKSTKNTLHFKLPRPTPCGFFFGSQIMLTVKNEHFYSHFCQGELNLFLEIQASLS